MQNPTFSEQELATMHYSQWMAKCSTAHQHDYKRILQVFAQLCDVNGTVPKGRPTHCNYYAGREREVQQWVKHSKTS